MKILIIGSKGFIGSYLSQYFQAQGHELYGADVVVDYTAGESYFLMDAANSDFRSLFEQQQFGLCINCSGAASVPHSLQKPYRDFSLNTANVFKLLEAIRVYNPTCKFINFSSAAVYGNPQSLPIIEGQDCAPLSPYGQHKWMSEQICSEFHRYFQIPTCSLRVFSAYGEGLRKQLFWDIAQKAKGQKQIELYGTGKESRDFIYIRDLAFAVDCVMQRAAFAGEAINVANGEEVTIQEAVGAFLENFAQSKAVSFGGQERQGDPLNWVANIDLLKSLGYQPKYRFREGLAQYYQWLEAENQLN